MDFLQTADAGADHYTGPNPRFLVVGLPAGIANCLLGGCQAIDDERAHAPLFLRRHPVVGVEAAIGGLTDGNLRGDLCRQVRDIERLDRAEPGFSVDQAIPVRLYSAPEGRDKAKTCYNYASHVPVVSSSDNICQVSNGPVISPSTAALPAVRPWR